MSLRRAAAVVTTTALVSVAGLAGGALLGVAHAEDVFSVTPPSSVNNGIKAITINGAGFGPSSSLTAVLRPTFSGAEVGNLTVTLDSNTPSACEVTSSCSTLTGTVPLLAAATGKYDLVVTRKSAPADEVDVCPACFLVQSANDITVTRVGPSDNGDGSLSITGTNFAVGASVSFLKPDGTVDPYMSFVPGGTPDDITGAATTGYPSSTQILGQYTAANGSTPGPHQLRVSNTDGNTGSTASFTQPLIGSIVPGTLGQGAKNFVVTVNGSGFHPTSTIGISNPTNPDVTLAGPPVIKADGTQILVPLSATSTAGVTGRSLTVRGADGDYVTAAIGSGLTVTTSPKWTATSPGSRGQGSTGTVTMTGTGFAPGVAFSFGPGVVATTVSATATTAVLTVVVDPNAPTTGRNVVVTNPDGGTTTGAPTTTNTTVPFTVNARPQVTSLSPASSARGATVRVTLNGSGMTGSSVVTVGDPGGITVTTVGPVAGGLVAQFATATGAVTGARDVTVTNPDGGTFLCTGCFSVNSLGVTSSSPVTDSTASRALTFTGSGLTSSSTLTLYRHGRPAYQAPLTPTAGTTPMANADGSLTATFGFVGVAPGQYDAEAVTPGGSLLCSSCFLVASSVQPSVTAVAPAAGGQGAPANAVVITGTGFTKGMVATLGSGITTAATSYDSPTQLTATIAIDPAAPTGTRNVTVTAGDTSTSAVLPSAYTVNLKPVPTTVAPTSRGQGYAGDVTVSGPNFVDGAKISFGNGITAVVKSIAQGSLTTSTDILTATLAIATNAPSGTHDITIINPDGGLGVCTACFTVNVGPGVSAVSPASIAPDPAAAVTVNNVVLTGVSFTGTPAVVIPNVTVTNVAVAPGGATLTATFTVDKAATTGVRTVTVTNPDGGTSICTACFYLAVPADAPDTISVVPGDQKATVSWTPPASDGGAPITNYVVQAGVGGEVRTVAADVRSQSFTGLPNSATEPVTFTVQARTVAGDGAAAAEDAIVNAPPTTDPAVVVTILGAQVVHPTYLRTFYLQGTAPAGAVVTLHFNKGGSPNGEFSIVRNVTANSSGAWIRAIVPNVDYRYFASVGNNPASVSGTVLNQPAPTLDGPDSRQVDKNTTYTMTGTSVPGSTVYLHFHKAGTPANDYSIVRAIGTDASGKWARAYTASCDYRVFVSRSAGSEGGSASYLFRTR